jgi:hypothetical protein
MRTEREKAPNEPGLPKPGFHRTPFQKYAFPLGERLDYLPIKGGVFDAQNKKKRPDQFEPETHRLA